MARKPGKKIIKARAQVEARSYKLGEASETIKKTHFVKFDETVELVVNLGIEVFEKLLFFLYRNLQVGGDRIGFPGFWARRKDLAFLAPRDSIHRHC